MTREKAIQELISIIPIGRTQNDRYIEELIKIINKPKPTEQEILKKFEDMGYRYKPIIIDNEICWAVFFNYETDDVIQIHKKELIYEKYDDSNFEIKRITLEEHKLLNELFKCWGWIDE